jgi:hypothetical protein
MWGDDLLAPAASGGFGRAEVYNRKGYDLAEPAGKWREAALGARTLSDISRDSTTISNAEIKNRSPKIKKPAPQIGQISLLIDSPN